MKRSAVGATTHETKVAFNSDTIVHQILNTTIAHITQNVCYVGVMFLHHSIIQAAFIQHP